MAQPMDIDLAAQNHQAEYLEFLDDEVCFDKFFVFFLFSFIIMFFFFVFIERSRRLFISDQEYDQEKGNTFDREHK